MVTSDCTSLTSFPSSKGLVNSDHHTRGENNTPMGARTGIPLAANGSTPYSTAFNRSAVSASHPQNSAGMQEILGLTEELQNSRDRCWQIAKGFFAARGFDGVVCAVIDKAQGNIAGILAEMPANWRDIYIWKNYIEIDPWVPKALSTDKPFIYTFENRASCFPNHCERVGQMLLDQRENGLYGSLLLPSFHLEDYVLALNLWHTDTVKLSPDYVKSAIGMLTIAGAVVSNYLAEMSLQGLFSNTETGWVRNAQFVNPLSAREQEVLKWLSTGLRNDRIAMKMGIALSTVNFHLRSICKKLAAKTREQALAIATSRKYIRL